MRTSAYPDVFIGLPFKHAGTSLPAIFTSRLARCFWIAIPRRTSGTLVGNPHHLRRESAGRSPPADAEPSHLFISPFGLAASSRNPRPSRPVLPCGLPAPALG